MTTPLAMLPTTTDPHDGVKAFADYRGDLHERCEVLVVGSGPGGAVVAKELAERGHDVILLEEGPPMGRREFKQEAGEAMHVPMRMGRTTAQIWHHAMCTGGPKQDYLQVVKLFEDWAGVSWTGTPDLSVE